MIANKIDSGMLTITTSVERQLPMNSKIITPVSSAAMIASCTTLEIDARTNTD
jgi:hypothetical protein